MGNLDSRFSMYFFPFSYLADKGVLHPHPLIGKMFQQIGFMENVFGIDLSAQCPNCSKMHDLKRCGQCKKVKYCSAQCQVIVHVFVVISRKNIGANIKTNVSPLSPKYPLGFVALFQSKYIQQ